MPSGKRDQPIVEDNHDGTVSLKYGPKEEGLHELFVKYNGENIQGKFIFIIGRRFFFFVKNIARTGTKRKITMVPLYVLYLLFFLVHA